MNSKIRRMFRWFLPGIGVKRWLLLMLLGMALLGLGTVLVMNLFAYELTALVGGPLRSSVTGAAALVLGVLLVGAAVRGVVKSIARATLSDENQLVDVMLARRKLGSGLRIVAIGGGTGLSSLLRGLKAHTSNITAIVTISDDGGSSGRLRQDLPTLTLSPGDIRNCIAALADEEPLMTQLLQYRFDDTCPELAGHSFGNLLIGALEEITGDFEKAIRETSRVLAVRGRVLPPTLQPVELCAQLKDGTNLRGESAIGASPHPIDYIFLDPPAPEALPEAVEAISTAELIVIGPGSLYTSILPNLLVPGIKDALATAPGVSVYVCNVMTQPGETAGMTTASAHVAALQRHVEETIFDYVVVNNRRPETAVLQRYEEQGAEFVNPDLRGIARLGFLPRESALLADDDYARHDPAKLARLLISLALENPEPVFH